VALDAVWRLIGPLQRNKARQAVETFDAVDTVGSAELVSALGRRLEGRTAPLPVLLQIRLGDEATKSGVEAQDAAPLLEAVQQTPALQCLGLMTMPPPQPPNAVRRYFAALGELAVRLREQSGLPLPVLSMGMSHDYEVAIEEGATHVRLGTVLFGPRTG
jgi:pyridoxal phosphate enzyme (YggS family)